MRTICVVNDIGFERIEALYGTSDLGDGSGAATRLLMKAAVWGATRGRYQLTEQDYHRWSMRQALRRVNLIVTCSRFTADEIHAAYPNASPRVQVIPWAIDGSRFADRVPSTQMAAVRHRYGIQDRYILFVGRLERKKNVRVLVDGFARMRQVGSLPHQLVLAGAPGYGYSEIRDSIDSQGLTASVVETGWLAEDDLPSLLQGADLFVFPSLYEGFGLPILEAQTAGVPLICSDLPVMHEVAGDGALFFQSRDPDELAGVALSMLNNAELGFRYVAAGRRNAARFSWGHTAEAYWRVLAEELVRTPTGST